MSHTITFTGTLEAARGGGHLVAVDRDLAASIGAKHRTRVRGAVNGIAYRSNLVSMGGRLVLGVHKATVQAAGVSPGDAIEVTMALDREPLANDVVPPELRSRLDRSEEARAAWDRLPPSHRRRYVGSITGAKRAETRERRAADAVDRILAAARSEP